MNNCLVDGSWSNSKIPQAHANGVNAISWCPSLVPGMSLFQNESSKATMIKRLATGGSDGCVKIWKFVEDEDKWIEEFKLEGHSDWVRDVAWAPSIGKSYIASCGQDRRVVIWKYNAQTKNWDASKCLDSFQDIVWHVSWSITGNILAVSGGDSKVSLFRETFSGEWILISEIPSQQK